MKKNQELDRMKKQKILITGSSGFIGRNIYSYLIGKGHNVVGLAHKNIIKEQKIIRGDILDLASLKKAMKNIDLVIHCAALVGGHWAKEMYKVNSEGTRNVLDVAINAGVKRIVHMSSLAVADEYIDHFGDSEDIPYPQEFRNHYTSSKIEAERYALKKKEDIKIIILRPGWVWGPGDQNINEFFQMVKDGRFRFIGSGNNLTYFTHIDNILQAIELALFSEKVGSGEIFNITDGVKLTMAKFVNSIAVSLDKPPVTKHVPVWMANSTAFFSERMNPKSALTRQNVHIMSKNLHFSISRARKILKYKPDNNLKEQIKGVIEKGIW